MLWDLELLFARKYNARAALRDGGILMKCTLFIPEKNAGPMFTGKGWLLHEYLGFVERTPGKSLNLVLQKFFSGDGSGETESDHELSHTMYVGFRVAENLEAHVLLGTAIISTEIRTIYVISGHIVMNSVWANGVVDDLPRKGDGATTVGMQPQQVDERRFRTSLSRDCRIFCKVTLKPGTETSVIVQSDDRRIVTLGTHESLCNLLQVSMTKSVAEVTWGCRFFLYPSKLTDMTVQILKEMAIDSKVEATDLTMDVSRWSDVSVNEMSVIVNAIALYKKNADHDTRMTRYHEVNEEKHGNKNHNWLTLINVNEEYGEERQEILCKVRIFESTPPYFKSKLVVSVPEPRHDVRGSGKLAKPKLWVAALLSYPWER